MRIRKLMVIGAGQMGSGIAQAAAQTGISVMLNDMKEAFVEAGIQKIEANLKRQVEKGTMHENQMAEVLGLIQMSTSLEEAESCDMALEAVTENLEIKKRLFHQLGEILPESAILATNTSAISITKLAGNTKHPEKVIGMHFYNPAPVMKLVEVVRGLSTSNEVFDTIYNLAVSLKKTPVEVYDFPGFVGNRILLLMINEAIYCVQEGVSSVEDVDRVMQLGMNHPMGPLALGDFIGLDNCLAIMEVLHEGFGDSKYRPCPLLRNYVDAGWLGRKSGRGFYCYNESGQN